MSKGWITGTGKSAQEIARGNQRALGRGPGLAATLRESREAVGPEALARQLAKRRKTSADQIQDGKSADWKLAFAAALKARAPATNRWPGTPLHLGTLHEVSPKVAAD
ncbi:MAG: hypothetical protein C0502_11275 [Opitutus sp.]|nr:hypothetical protein [Opitutus sp.]